MIKLLRDFLKILPSLLLAFFLSVSVWILAVTDSDPTEEKEYPNPVQIEIIGQDPGYLITSAIPPEVVLNLSAPQSIWDRMIRENTPVRAILDLSGKTPGTHVIPIQIQVGISPVRIVSYTPEEVNLTLEALSSRSVDVKLVQRGEVAVGYEAGDAVVSQDTVNVTGAESLVAKVQDAQANLDINTAHENIDRSLNLVAVDSNGNPINGVTLNPDRIQVFLDISQRGGYRNLVVRPLLIGQIASGYRLTNISTFPPAVTIFSADPKLVDQIPGYVETAPFDINGATDDLDVSVNLNLPDGVMVVGEQMVQLQIGIAAIEGSLNLSKVNVTVIGQVEGMEVAIAPETVDIILAGPLPLLDALSASNVNVTLDVSELTPGTYQLTPRVELGISELRLQSILPQSIEATITLQPTPSPTPFR